MNIAVITTGGTIAKTYNESDGSLQNTRPVIDLILAGLRIPDLQLTCKNILTKDSIDLTDNDRDLIATTVVHAAAEHDGVIVAHGTDTLPVTGELLYRRLGTPRVPVVLTGAMRPYEFRDSDAAQNVTESLLAIRLVPPGIYVVMHNRVLKFPGVVKDRVRLSFVQSRPDGNSTHGENA
ncbi:MAG: asparaginase [Planctomycetes bacterium]|nr:asparaginase [Planctomycetota bacterium]